MLNQAGEFNIGCNYWASHAGIFMWSNWQPEIVDADLRHLAESGMGVLRVFPLWPDFQPLTLLRSACGAPREYRMGEEPLPDTEAGRAGVDQEMMERFRFLADSAKNHGLELVVGLLTGWMSGRLFMPRAFENMNLLTDPAAIVWETRFVKYFVRCFKEHPAITAWDLGNECNCMGMAHTREDAWLWASQISNAIKAVDVSRPVISGMHSLKAEAAAGIWLIQDQAELTDVLTTHPYPIFTPHCNQDPIPEIRNCLHATAESCFYADIGGRPCIVEEIGTLGPMICSERISADYLRTVLFSSWAHDQRMLLWWCAYDQDHLDYAPYDWNAVERLLGLARKDREPKPVMREFTRFREFLNIAPKLPPRVCDAVCILTRGQDQWGIAQSSFILAKQAGFDIRFQYADQPLKAASLYLLPGITAHDPISRHRMGELLERVRAGARLYVSCGQGLLAPFTGVFGLEVQTRELRNTAARFSIAGTEYALQCEVGLNLKPLTATVLGHEPTGNPVFARNPYGQGEIFFLGLPLEQSLSNMPGAFHREDATPWYRIYALFADAVIRARAAVRDNPCVGITEHPASDGSRYLVLVNYSSGQAIVNLELRDSWRVSDVMRGNQKTTSGKFEIPGNDAVALRLAES